MEINLHTLEFGKVKELDGRKELFWSFKSELSGISMMVPRMILGVHSIKKFFKNLSSYIFTLGVLICFFYLW